MIQCIQYRKSSFLESRDWQTIPWEQTPKDVHQKLLDKGFALAALLEMLDSANLMGPDCSLEDLSTSLQRLSDLNFQMEQWFDELLAECPTPLYWPTEATPPLPSSPPTDWSINEDPDPNSLPSFVFPSLRIANITVTYWALRTVLSNAIAIVCGVILTADDILTRVEDPSQSAILRENAQSLLSRHGSIIRLELATKIMQSMRFCLSDAMGLLGAQKSLFSLRTALFTLRRYPGQELKWCQAVYEKVDSKRGLRYAREIAKIDKGLGTGVVASLSTGGQHGESSATGKPAPYLTIGDRLADRLVI